MNHGTSQQMQYFFSKGQLHERPGPSCQIKEALGPTFSREKSMGSQGRSTFPALESFEAHRKTVPQLKSTCHTGEPHTLTSGLSTGALLMCSFLGHAYLIGDPFYTHPRNPTSGTLLGDERGDTRSVLPGWGKDHTSNLGGGPILMI